MRPSDVLPQLEWFAADSGYDTVKAWYDDDNDTFKMQVTLSMETLDKRIYEARPKRLSLPVAELARKIVAQQVGKGLRRYGRKRR